MKSILVLHAHPAPRHSNANTDLAKVAQEVEGVTFVDLYARYPRFKINIDKEQEQLLAHDVIIFQFPLMWYSTPSLLKEWQDLVLEYGFAYGEGGTALAGKCLLPVVSVGGPQTAYAPQGNNNFELPSFLSPLQQTANLCSMRYVSPFTLFASLRARNDGRLAQHTTQYRRLLEALRDDEFDFESAKQLPILTAENISSVVGEKK